MCLCVCARANCGLCRGFEPRSCLVLFFARPLVFLSRALAHSLCIPVLICPKPPPPPPLVTPPLEPPCLKLPLPHLMTGGRHLKPQLPSNTPSHHALMAKCPVSPPPPPPPPPLHRILLAFPERTLCISSTWILHEPLIPTTTTRVYNVLCKGGASQTFHFVLRAPQLLSQLIRDQPSLAPKLGGGRKVPTIRLAICLSLVGMRPSGEGGVVGKGRKPGASSTGRKLQSPYVP